MNKKEIFKLIKNVLECGFVGFRLVEVEEEDLLKLKEHDKKIKKEMELLRKDIKKLQK